MNIQEQLFKIFNVVKYRSFEFDEKWHKAVISNVKDSGSKIDPLDHYYAAYYGGAYDAAKIMLKCYQGEFSNEDIEYWLNKLDNIGNELKAN